MIKNLIFDWGGVLIQGEHNGQILQIIKEKYNLDIDHDTWVEHKRKLDKNEWNMEQFCIELKNDFNFEISIENMEKVIAEAIIPNKLLLDELPKLKKKFRLFMLSNNDHFTVEYSKKTYPEMFKYFEACYISCEQPFHKKQPEAWLELLEEQKLNAKECIFIDDMKKNTDVAKKLNFKTIKFENTEKFNEELTKLTK